AGRGFRPAAPELADAGLAIEVVAEKDLVGALAGENHLDSAIAHQPTQPQEGSWGRAQQDLLPLPHHLRQRLSDFTAGDEHRAMTGGEPARHLVLEGALVEARIVEADRERHQGTAQLRLRDGAEE